MTDIRDYIQVTIDRQTRSISRQGFGTALVATGVVPEGFTERVRFYTAAAQMLDDGFLESSDAYKAVSKGFQQSPRPVQIGVGRVQLTESTEGADDAETWTAGLGAIADENNEWYALIATTRAAEDILEIAAWIEGYSTTKMYGTASSDPNATSTATSDIGYQLKQLARSKTWTFWHEDPTTFPEAALFGRCLAAAPGSITWAFKQLSGIPPSDNLTKTQTTNLSNKNYVYYQTVGGAQITQDPKVAVGEWIDIMHGVDWLNAQITEALFSLLVNLPKLPFTDKGITAVQGEISAQLKRGQQADFLTTDKPYSVTVPKRADVSAADQAARTLNDVTFIAYLSGAIHFINGVHGTVTY